MSESEKAEGASQLTQGSEHVFKAINQHPSDGDQSDVSQSSKPIVFFSEEMKDQYLRDVSLVKHDGFIWEMGGKCHTLAFFRPSFCDFQIKVDRGDDMDIAIPSKDGSCGISQFAF